MDKNEIINKIAKERWVEKIARHYNTFAKEDLCQYVYLYLLTKVDDEKIIELYQTKQLKQYITGIIHRQVISTKSDYVRTYKQIGFSTENEDENELKYVNKLVYIPEEDAHQLENEVDKYLNSLPDEEKDIMYMLMQSLQERGEDIKIWCNRYGKTQHQYTALVPILKQNFAKHLNIKTKNKQKGKYNNTKVQMIDYKTGEVVRTFTNMRECKLELEPKGYNINAIYSCLINRQKQHNGYIFSYQR